MSDRAAVALRIDRLVLIGFSPLDAARLRDAFSAALRQGLDREPEAPAVSSVREVLRLSTAAARGPEAIGRAAARALIEALRA